MEQIKNIKPGFFKLVASGLIATTLFGACNKDNDNNTTTSSQHDVIYLQSNNFNTGQNTVLAYQDNGAGVLSQLTGSPFSSGGAGNINLGQILGPEDSDNETIFSADGKFLLTVNSGSNTIAVFSVAQNGQLTAVAGSPFPSGGQTPVSLAVSGSQIFVVNKAQDLTASTQGIPNYTSFTLGVEGNLTPNSGATTNTTAGTSPSQIILSADKKFAFGDDFLGFMLPTPVGTLRSFTVGTNGTLTSVAGSPYTLPAGAMPDNGALGLWMHPSGNILYVGIPVQGKIGVFNVNTTSGALSLQTTVAAGKAACWLRGNKAGNHLYVLNSGDNQVQVYNTATAASPVSIQTLELKNSGPVYTNPAGVTFKTSEAFSLNFSSDEKILYVISQHTNTDFTIGNFNYLHSLNIADDGSLTEATTPIQLPVPANTRPKGLAVVSRTP